MITVVSGGVGEGKSYWCSKMIIDHVCAGGIVATNMSLDPDRISVNFHRRLNPRQFLQLSASSDPRKIPRGDLRGVGRRRVVVVLDEALNWFASSATASDPRRATWGEWLRQSDKLGQNVFFVAQSFDRSAKWIRELAQRLIVVSNMRNFSFLRLPFGRWLGLDRLSLVRNVDVRSGMGTGFEIMYLSSHVWNCYRTSELYGFDASFNAYDGLAIFPPAKFPRLVFVIPVFASIWSLFRYVSA